MNRDSSMNYDVRAGSFSTKFINTEISIIEMTAEILVCCMPTTSALFKRIKISFSSYDSSAALHKSSRIIARHEDKNHDERKTQCP